MVLFPLFDSIAHIHHNHERAILPDEQYREDFHFSLTFLKSYTGSLGTFNSYRREVERLLQWSWHIAHKKLPALTRDDIEHYLHFCQYPPQNWIAYHKVARFIENEGLRSPNPAWRPFVATISKSLRKEGAVPELSDANLAPDSIREIFAILGTFFNFLIAEEYLFANPVALIRQKSKFIRKRQLSAPVRRLSMIQWDAVIRTAEQLAFENPAHHERTRFILTLLFGMYLRISELAASTRWVPSMNHFVKDSQGCWWFTTVGKGNKERQIAVSDDMLKSLTRWRQHLGLSALPAPSDNSPLIPKLRGQGAMSDTAPLRRLVQLCFDNAEAYLRKQQLNEEADSLRTATVHWLRHTGISEDVKIRPREHVRDDAGHSSSATTDRYIDVEKYARHHSARHKKIESEPLG